MDRAKILDKIQKCLALGKSPNEHEAAAAMRQAQKLMERHGVTERELGVIGYGVETVVTSIQANGKAVPLVLQTITSLCMVAFGVRAAYTRTLRVSDYGFCVNYYGPQHRAMLAAYAHEVVQRAVDQAWAKYLREHPDQKRVHGARAGFYVGWIHSVRSKVTEFGMTEEETTLSIEVLKVDKDVERNKQKLDGHAVHKGAKAGESFDLHRPVALERLKIER